MRWNYLLLENIVESVNFRNYSLNLLDCFSSKLRCGIKKDNFGSQCERGRKE